MNENPSGTPNTPNNQTPPSPGTNPLPPTNPFLNPQPATNPSQTASSAQTFNQPPYGSPTVSARQPAPAPEPPKKKKTGLIIGIIIAIIVFIGAIAGLAYLLIFANQKDPVATAFKQLISGETPQYINLAGNINFHSNTTDALVSDLTVDLSSNFDTRSFLNSSKLTFTTQTTKNQTFSASLSETYAANGDLYFKIDNLSTSLEGSGFSTFLGAQNATQTVTDEVLAEGVVITEDSASEVTVTETTTDSITPMSVIKKLDGEWVKISTDEVSSIFDNLFDNSDIAYAINLAVGAASEKNSLSELYKQYPFLVSSKETVSVPSKANPIYRISVDEQKLENFFNTAKANKLASKLASRLDIDASSLTFDDVKNTLASFPAFYVEVDNNYNITRFYTTANYKDTTATIDLSLSYPTSITVSEPLEYKEYDVLMQEINTTVVQEVDTIQTPESTTAD